MRIVGKRRAGELRGQLHDDVCQEGRAHVFGRAGRRTELRDHLGIYGTPETLVVGLVVQRVAGLGRFRPVGPIDRATAQRLRGQHRSARQIVQPDQHHFQIGRHRCAGKDISVHQNEYVMFFFPFSL